MTSAVVLSEIEPTIPAASWNEHHYWRLPDAYVFFERTTSHTWRTVPAVSAVDPDRSPPAAYHVEVWGEAGWTRVLATHYAPGHRAALAAGIRVLGGKVYT